MQVSAHVPVVCGEGDGAVGDVRRSVCEQRQAVIDAGERDLSYLSSLKHILPTAVKSIECFFAFLVDALMKSMANDLKQ